MTKWIILGLGVFLFFNGTMSRTYSFTDPPKHCFNMDYINLSGCFGSPAIPAAIVWGAGLLGAAMMAVALVQSRRAR